MLLRIGAAFRVPPISMTGCRTSMTNLVEIRGLNVRFSGERTVHAVNDLSLSLARRGARLLGRVRFGQERTLRALMRLLRRADADSGSVQVLGRDVWHSTTTAVGVSRPDVSMIFQEPALALDPVYTIGGRSRKP